MAPSTQKKTVTPTRTPAADGSKRRERQSPARVIQVLREVTLPPQKVGDRKKRAADRQLMAEVGTAGNPGQRVREVRRAAVVEEVGVEEEVARAGKT